MVTVEIIGRERLFAALDGLAKAAEDARPWDKHDEIHRTHQATHLDTRGSGTWPPNKPQTEARKRADPRTTFLEQMQQTGQLYLSLTRKFAPFNVTEETPTEYVSGTRDPKAILHHTGRGRLPVRELKRVTQEEVGEHEREFVTRKKGEAARLGFEVTGGV